METNNNYLAELSNKLKNNLPSSEQIQRVVKDNQEVATVAAGAFLAVVGLKFISKTIGFLAFAGGATMLYRSAMANRTIKDVVDRIATPSSEEATTVSPKIYADSI